MNRTGRIGLGCGTRRFASLIAAEKAAERGAAGTPEECRRFGLLHWHLKVPAPRLGFSAEVKLLCRVRAGNGEAADAMCEACGCHLGAKYGEVQHRDARGAGGSRSPVTNGLANAVLLCGMAVLGTGCHGECERRDRGMNELGFWLENGQDPRTTPVGLHGQGSGITAWLHESEPRYLLAEPRIARAA